MDALPMKEESGLEYASTTGAFHAYCKYKLQNIAKTIKLIG